ncbi:uncharacterized protein isoform X22 [Macaca fascicularis]|uniref:uncharacterized protein isoform X22 n=1 Tax=Macaca fascicularis TaxID=9541 RepID=UPI003D15549E
MADFLRNLLTFKYFRSKDCCSNGAHRERVCKFWSKQEWEADKSSSKSSSLHAPQSRYQELEVALDSSSATINQLNENVESLKQQKKQVEHQLEECLLGFSPKGSIPDNQHPHVGKGRLEDHSLPY